MATNTPSIGLSVISPLLTFLSLTPVTEAGIGGEAGSPVISSTTVSHITVTFSLRVRRSLRIFSERNSSRLWTTVTWRARFDR